MAVYTPKDISVQAALTATGGTSIFTGTGGHVYVIRTVHAQSAASGKNFTLSIKADAAGTRLFDAYALTANIPAIFNGWWVFQGSAAHDLDASCAATAVNLGVYGYDYA